MLHFTYESISLDGLSTPSPSYELQREKLTRILQCENFGIRMVNIGEYVKTMQEGSNLRSFPKEIFVLPDISDEFKPYPLINYLRAPIDAERKREGASAQRIWNRRIGDQTGAMDRSALNCRRSQQFLAATNEASQKFSGNYGNYLSDFLTAFKRDLTKSEHWRSYYDLVESIKNAINSYQSECFSECLNGIDQERELCSLSQGLTVAEKLYAGDFHSITKEEFRELYNAYVLAGWNGIGTGRRIQYHIAMIYDSAAIVPEEYGVMRYASWSFLRSDRSGNDLLGAILLIPNRRVREEMVKAERGSALRDENWRHPILNYRMQLQNIPESEIPSHIVSAYS